MKYKGKYRAYIGLIIINTGMHLIQLGTMTPKEAKEKRSWWHQKGFDWIIWREPTKEEIKKAKK